MPQRNAVRVLAFPVTDVQLSALPFGSPDTVVLHYTRLLTRIAKTGPLLSPEECVRLLSECALTEQIVESMELAARWRVEHQAKRLGLLA